MTSSKNLNSASKLENQAVVGFSLCSIFYLVGLFLKTQMKVLSVMLLQSEPKLCTEQKRQKQYSKYVTVSGNAEWATPFIYLVMS